MAWRHPFDKKLITSRFGATANRPTPHRGLDYAPKANTVIPAASGGVIRRVAWSNVLGWYVVQEATDRITGKKVFIGYCHLSCSVHGPECKGPTLGAHSPLKSTVVGQAKKLGEAIGKVGNTGSASRGAHLHLTIGPTENSVISGKVIDPEQFIDEQLAGPKSCPTCKRAF